MCGQFQKILAQIRKKICLPTKESISGDRGERISMAVRCEMFMNCSKIFKGTCKKSNMTVKQGILKGS